MMFYFVLFEILIRRKEDAMQTGYMFYQLIVCFFLQHSLLGGWPLYITPREGFLGHETSRRASWESCLPVFEWVGKKGSLVCIYKLSSQGSNKISCWYLLAIVVLICKSFFIFYFLFFFHYTYFCFFFSTILHHVYNIPASSYAPDVKLFFSFFWWHSIVKSSLRGAGIFLGLVSLPYIVHFCCLL